MTVTPVAKLAKACRSAVGSSRSSGVEECEREDKTEGAVGAETTKEACVIMNELGIFALTPVGISSQIPNFFARDGHDERQYEYFGREWFRR